MNSLTSQQSQYLAITANYWAFTLTDGALRMLVVLYFHQLGYNALMIAMLFLLYEFCGVLTNLFGGWLGARWGLNRTMHLGLGLQIVALCMLLVPEPMLTVVYVMAAQALSGIAKDLNKMSAKSAIKTLVPDSQQGQLFRWVAILTGSKNTLKGIGFFLGGVLLAVFGFQTGIALMAGSLAVVLLFSLWNLRGDLGTAKNKPKFKDIFSRSRSINVLSAARMLLFGARDVWFVVALPVFLMRSFGWSHLAVGGFIAAWVVLYGFVQAFAPQLTGHANGRAPDGRSALYWVAGLSIIPALIALGMQPMAGLNPTIVVVGGLFAFGAVFAVNSSMHSYLVVSYAESDGASVDVGFYYMANAMGRLIGTALSGWVFVQGGLEACLWVSAAMLLAGTLISFALPRTGQQHA